MSKFKMEEKEKIAHDGVVKEIVGNHIKVEISKRFACHGCQNINQCHLSQNTKEVIDVYSNKEQYALQEQVKVLLPKDDAHKALLIAYVFPFICVIVTLLISYRLTQNEFIAGISALFILIPYFLSFKFFNKKFQNNFHFEIAKK